MPTFVVPNSFGTTRLLEGQKELALKYGIEEFDYPTPDSQIRHIGYAPKTQKWYGWSHRAVFGFKVGDRVKKGDVIANSSEYSGRLALPEGFTAKTLADAKRMAAAFAVAVS